MIIRFGRKTFLKDGTNVGAVVHALDGRHDKRRMAAPRGARNHADALMMLFVVDACGGRRKLFDTLHTGGGGNLIMRRRNFYLGHCVRWIVGI